MSTIPEIYVKNKKLPVQECESFGVVPKIGPLKI